MKDLVGSPRLRSWCRRLTALAAPMTLVAALGLQSAPVLATSPLTPQSFTSCVEQLQKSRGGTIHRLTLAEGRACAPGIPVIDRNTALTSASLPRVFLAVSGSQARFVQTASSSPSRAASTVGSGGALLASSCWNTWTYPAPWSSDGVSTVGINVAGYGNHCNYANVPNSPTVSIYCACTGSSVSKGHYDSVWSSNNYGQNYAAGWANITLYLWPAGIDSWSCRGYVNTNGQQSPGGWCL